jgi:hypothetical protein
VPHSCSTRTTSSFPKVACTLRSWTPAWVGSAGLSPCARRGTPSSDQTIVCLPEHSGGAARPTEKLRRRRLGRVRACRAAPAAACHRGREGMESPPRPGKRWSWIRHAWRCGSARDARQRDVPRPRRLRPGRRGARARRAAAPARDARRAARPCRSLVAPRGGNPARSDPVDRPLRQPHHRRTRSRRGAARGCVRRRTGGPAGGGRAPTDRGSAQHFFRRSAQDAGGIPGKLRYSGGRCA